MRLLSVNTGRPRPVPGRASRGSPATTGIYKEPAGASVTITTDGLVGDAVQDQRYHGGPDQAVYVYTQPDYAWFAGALGLDLAPGTFGENLTVSDLESAAVRIGDRFRIGAVVIEATAPRIPCGTFGKRMAVPGFVKTFVAAGRPGFYCRVLAGGEMLVGVELERVSGAGSGVTIGELFRAYYAKDLPAETLRRFLAAPVSSRERERLEQRLAGS